MAGRGAGDREEETWMHAAGRWCLGVLWQSKAHQGMCNLVIQAETGHDREPIIVDFL